MTSPWWIDARSAASGRAHVDDGRTGEMLQNRLDPRIVGERLELAAPDRCRLFRECRVSRPAVAGKGHQPWPPGPATERRSGPTKQVRRRPRHWPELDPAGLEMDQLRRLI
jgi:hypothetical protein